MLALTWLSEVVRLLAMWRSDHGRMAAGSGGIDGSVLILKSCLILVHIKRKGLSPLQCWCSTLMLQILLCHRLAACSHTDRKGDVGKRTFPSEHQSLQKHSPLVRLGTEETRCDWFAHVCLEHTAAGDALLHNICTSLWSLYIRISVEYRWQHVVACTVYCWDVAVTSSSSSLFIFPTPITNTAWCKAAVCAVFTHSDLQRSLWKTKHAV